MKRKKTIVTMQPGSEEKDHLPVNQEEAPEPVENLPPEEVLPIVGIGASAGGLAAFEAFFSAMPAETDPGMAFVIVQHLAPDHKSILTDLIRRYTRMQVHEVEDGMKVLPNSVYIIPPNHDMAFLNGSLQLLEPGSPRGQRLPIDFFFRSLAQDQHERAIGIILTGTGSDGTLGVRAIKGEGGVVMVQSPESTEYDGMPRSAIATGLVDFVLPPAEMPAQLIAYTAQAFGRLRPSVVTALPKAESALKKMFILVRAQTGHDFSQYKPSTVNRRIERRMAVHQISRLDDYARYLQHKPEEITALFRDLLIGVTNFFRDPEAFKTLGEQIVLKLVADKPADASIRVWVPGCSTGEEAYSIAILFQENLEKLKRGYKVQVFGTDIDAVAIATARAGLYPASVAADISPERLARFFTSESGGAAYRINKGVRDMLVFSEHDVIKDPPFSKMDLISCRNLLIYMSNDLQKKLIPLFHYALNPQGFLFLGTSETVGEFLDLFAALDRKTRLYQKKEALRARNVTSSQMNPPMMPIEGAVPRGSRMAIGFGKPSLRELTEHALLQQVGMAGALVNGRGEIHYLHGRTGMYLEPTPGEVGANNILKMAREGLRHSLTVDLHKAVGTKEIVHHPGLRVRTNGDFTTINLTIRPVAAGTPEAFLYLIIMEQVPASDTEPPQYAPLPDTTAGQEGSVASLRQELRAKEEYLQATNEELETSNEELQSSNEEMQSVNEELQSTNEELETSKEELQSVNEELATVNAELQTKVAELSQANNDMNNLLAGTGIATVFVDHQLRIMRFTPTATHIINLRLSDIGRPVGHIVSNLVDYNSLIADTQTVLDGLVPKELEVQSQAGEWYSMRIQPYRTLENVIEGVVLTFTNITEIKKARNVLRASEDLVLMASVVRDARDAVTVLTMEGKILLWNQEAERAYGWSEAEALAMNIRDTVPEKNRKEVMSVLLRLSSAMPIKPYRIPRICKDGRIVETWLTATALTDQTGKIYGIVTTERTTEKEPATGKTARS